MDYRDHKVVLEDGTEIATRTFIWVSGVTGVTIGNLDASLIGRGGRIKVDSFNRVEGMNNVFAIGDQCIQLADEITRTGILNWHKWRSSKENYWQRI